MNEKDKELAHKILRSNYLKSTYLYILNHKSFMQKDLKKELPIKYYSHISSTIKFFRENDLIKCENEKEINFKMYTATEKFYNLKEEIGKYEKTN